MQSNDVLIDVKAIGLCRTDLYAIDQKIETANPTFVPGHEFSGVISELGCDVSNLSVGDRVVVNPVLSCQQCSDCVENNEHLCANTKFMGVDFDGACREQVAVPGRLVFRVPEALSFRESVFAEPVAATLAVLNADITPEQKGLILGTGRIAKLAESVLRASDFSRIETANLDQARMLSANQFDFVVEVNATTEVLHQMGRLIRPRGNLILKSREYRPLEITIRDLIAKQPKISIVNYGRFTDAIQLLTDGRVDVKNLIGETFALSDFDAAFEAARSDESEKIILNPGS
ncbi:MAG: zinc-binding dehydrogenase [Mariniblastus sp.]